MYCEVITQENHKSPLQKSAKKPLYEHGKGSGSGYGGCGAGRCGVSRGAASDLYDPSDAEKPAAFHT